MSRLNALLSTKFLLAGTKVAVLTLVVGGLLACSGDTDGDTNSDDTFPGEQFVADAVGSILLSISSSSLAVSKTTGFSVSIRDAAGLPVEDLRVSCDTEAGLALIDPVTGSALTDGAGSISGTLGCAAPGSHKIVCRMPVGANKRDSAVVKCTGDFPEGFSGFDGAGGQGLGGGVANQEGEGDGAPGGTDSSAISVESVIVSDNAEETNTVDITLDECNENFPGDGEESEPEEFGDATFEVTIVNNGNSIITFNRYTITVPAATGAGTATYSSGSISALLEVGPNGDTAKVSGLPLAFSSGSGKRFAGVATTTIPALGFRNVTIRFFGTNDLGEDVVVAASVGLNFVNELNCT